MTAADACRFVGAKTSSLEGAKQRTLIARDYETAFERVDVIALPMSPTGAFRLGERVAHPIQMYLSHIFTVGAPLAGLPAITVPCGLAPGNLPVGLQLTGRRFEESTRYRIAAAYEQHAGDGIGVPPGFAA